VAGFEIGHSQQNPWKKKKFKSKNFNFAENILAVSSSSMRHFQLSIIFLIQSFVGSKRKPIHLINPEKENKKNKQRLKMLKFHSIWFC
jgi:hypothetical protein